jgi:hypothetical protein
MAENRNCPRNVMSLIQNFNRAMEIYVEYTEESIYGLM